MKTSTLLSGVSVLGGGGKKEKRSRWLRCYGIQRPKPIAERADGPIRYKAYGKIDNDHVPESNP